MIHRKKPHIIFPVLLVLSLTCLPLPAGSQAGHQRAAGDAAAGGPGTGPTAAYPAMAAPGKKIQLAGGHYFLYNFDKKTQLGTVIMKVEIFSREGKKETALEVKADTGMPSMRGAHETGERPFQVSRKGDYLLPINIVMPGDWEIKLSIWKEGQVIFRGSHKFDV